MSAEASNTIAALLASGQGLVGKLSFNITDYLNSTYGQETLFEQLRAYNVTTNLDELPFALINALNITSAEVAAPTGAARSLILGGLILFVSREFVVRWRIRRIMTEYSHHSS